MGVQVEEFRQSLWCGYLRLCNDVHEAWYGMVVSDGMVVKERLCSTLSHAEHGVRRMAEAFLKGVWESCV